MKIAILLPYKEDYTPKYSGAVSIHVSNLIKYSKYKNTTTVFGNTLKKKYLSKNFFNIKINKSLFSSNNKKYLEKFIEINKRIPQDLIEIHNRPSYVKAISKNLKSKLILYFHNNPLTLSGSKTLADRVELLDRCNYIFLIASGLKINFLTILMKINIFQVLVFVTNLQKKIKLILKEKKILFHL